MIIIAFNVGDWDRISPDYKNKILQTIIFHTKLHFIFPREYVDEEADKIDKKNWSLNFCVRHRECDEERKTNAMRIAKINSRHLN